MGAMIRHKLLRINYFILISCFLSEIAVGATNEGFGDKSGCIVIREVETGRLVYDSSSPLCKERLYPCSTFKIPLALMAFDQGIINNQSTSFKWDGKSQLIKSWEKDHNPRSWMKDSVVWFSQRITPQLGIGKIQNYLVDFQYGNRDFSGGIEKAWLSSTLKISPEEQLDFLLRLKRRGLKLKSDSIDKVLSILPIEVDEPKLKIYGKTGSGFSWEDPTEKASPYRVGWYVGFAKKDAKEYAFAVAFRDKSEKGKFSFGGMEARKIAVSFLREMK
jgi:beta-lactamase class D